MSVKQIPSQNEFGLELGPIPKKLHEGKMPINKELDLWRRNRLNSFLSTVDEQWNLNINQVFGKLYKKLKYYDVDQGMLDGSNIFADPNSKSTSSYWKLGRPQLISEVFFDLFTKFNFVQDSYTSIQSQVDRINNFTTIKSLLDLEDTPGSYVGQAGLFLGVDSQGTSFSFLKPKSGGSFLELTDTLDSYAADYFFLVGDGPGTSIQAERESMTRWNVQQHQCDSSVPILNVTGTGADNVIYSVDLQDEVTCPGQVLRLGTTFHGARVCFKAKLGDNNLNSKYIEGDTSAGVTLHEGNGAGSFQLGLGSSYTFVYDANSTSYSKIHQFVAGLS